jgi:hypothetical protein
MNRKIIRLAGVLLGVYLFWSYGCSFKELIDLKDGSAEQYWDHITGLMFAVFLVMPWRLIQSPHIWWVFYIVFWILFLKALSMCLLAATWAGLHGAGGAGTLPMVMGIVTFLQLIVIGLMRPKLRKM